MGGRTVRFQCRSRRRGALSPEQLLRLDLLTAVAVGLVFIDAAAAEAVFKQAFFLACSVGEPRRLSRALSLAAAFEAARGGSDERAKAFLNQADVLTPTLDAGLSAYKDAARGFRLLAGSDFVHADELLSRADLGFSRMMPGAYPLGLVRLGRLFSLRRLGKLRELRAARAEVLRYAERTQDRFLLATVKRGFRLVTLAYEGAEQALEELVPADFVYPAEVVRRTLGMPVETAGCYQDWLLHFGHHEINLFEGSVKVEHLALIEAAAAAPVGVIEFHRSEVEWLRGRAALAIQGLPAMVKTAEDAAQKLARGAPHAQAWSALLRAGLLVRKRDDGRASRALAEAISISEKHGMELCAAVAKLRLSSIDARHAEERAFWDDYVDKNAIPQDSAARIADLVAPGFPVIRAR
ncbi:MAG: hypothetical protein R3B70_48005, partial [Polyangiaceae bacterium]